MAERTPEFYQIDKIMDEVIAGGWFDVIDRTIRVDSHAISRLAAPLEAANARIRELEREVGESKLETALDAQAVRTENTTLREAVRVLAKELIEWRRSSRSVADVAPQTQSNPTAKAAIEAARKEHNGRDE